MADFFKYCSDHKVARADVSVYDNADYAEYLEKAFDLMDEFEDYLFDHIKEHENLFKKGVIEIENRGGAYYVHANYQFPQKTFNFLEKIVKENGIAYMRIEKDSYDQIYMSVTLF